MPSLFTLALILVCATPLTVRAPEPTSNSFALKLKTPLPDAVVAGNEPVAADSMIVAAEKLALDAVGARFSDGVDRLSDRIAGVPALALPAGDRLPNCRGA